MGLVFEHLYQLEGGRSAKDVSCHKARAPVGRPFVYDVGELDCGRRRGTKRKPFPGRLFGRGAGGELDGG